MMKPSLAPVAGSLPLDRERARAPYKASAIARRAGEIGWPRFSNGLAWTVFGLTGLAGMLVYWQPVVTGDGIAYFLYLRLLLLEQDPGFDIISYFPIGTALWNLPGFLLAHGAATFFPKGLGIAYADGWSWPYQAAFTLTNALTCLGAGFLLLEYGRRRGLPPATSLVVALAFFWGSPLPYYAFTEPSYSHALSAFANGLLFMAVVFLVNPGRTLHWGLLGALAGLVCITRWQDGCMAVVLVGYFLYSAGKLLPLEDFLRRSAVLLAFVLLVVTPQLVLNTLWLGAPWRFAHQQGFFVFPSIVRILQVLFSEEKGLFFWSPLLFIGFLSAVILAVKGSTPDRDKVPLPGFWWAVLGVFSITTLANAAALDWWAGLSFGNRRFLNLWFFLGLACLERLHVKPVPRRRAAWTLLPLAAVNLWYYQTATTGTIYLDHQTTLANTFKGMKDAGKALWDKVAGSPPQGLLLSYRGFGTLEFTAQQEQAGNLSGWRLGEWGGGSFGWNDGASSRALFHPARIQDLQVAFQAAAHPAIEDQCLTLTLNGKEILHKSLGKGISDLKAVLPARKLVPGPNVLEWRFRRAITPADQYPVEGIIGQTCQPIRHRIEVVSTKMTDGLRAAILVNRKPVMTCRRGYNVAALDGLSGEILGTATFDVYFVTGERERMEDWLDQWPEGTVIAASLKDFGPLTVDAAASDWEGKVQAVAAWRAEDPFQVAPNGSSFTLATFPDGRVLHRYEWDLDTFHHINRYAQWLSQLPAGSTLTQFNLFRNELSPTTALRSILEGFGAKYRHKLEAVIGVVGAQPGTALQPEKPWDGIPLVAGGSGDRQFYAAAIGALRFSGR